MFKRGSAKQSHLRNKRWTQSWQTAFALNGLDHCRLFTTDISASTASQLNLGQGVRRISLQPGKLLLQDFTAQCIFIASVDPDTINTDHTGSNQHPFEKAVRIALYVVPILEGTRLTLIQIHRHQTWRGLARDNLPFGTGWKTGTTETTQAAVLHQLNNVITIPGAVVALGSQLISPIRPVRIEADMRLWIRRHGYAAIDDSSNALRRGFVDGVEPDHHRRCFRATTDTRHGLNPHVAAVAPLQIRDDLLRTCQLTTDRVTDTNGQFRRCLLTFTDHIEVMVERGNLVHLRWSQS